MTAPRVGDGDNQPTWSGVHVTVPQPWHREQLAGAEPSCTHGRTRMTCADCQIVVQQEQGRAKPVETVVLDKDTHVPDPTDETRSTFYPAGTRVPVSYLSSPEVTTKG